jgi:hypothetical protein
MKVVWIPASQHRELRLIAANEETTIQDLVAIAIREYLERRSDENPEQKPLDAIAS